MNALLMRLGSLTWCVAVVSAVTIAVGSAAQMVPITTASTPAVSAPTQPERASAAIVRLADGPGAGLLRIQLSNPFSDLRVNEIIDRIGTDVVASVPAFVRCILDRPVFSVEGTGRHTASVDVRALATWSQKQGYRSDLGLALVRSQS